MRDDRGHVVALGQFDGIQGLGQSADLIQFDQNGVGTMQFDALLDVFDIGNEQVIADQLYPVT